MAVKSRQTGGPTVIVMVTSWKVGCSVRLESVYAGVHRPTGTQVGFMSSE